MHALLPTVSQSVVVFPLALAPARSPAPTKVPFSLLTFSILYILLCVWAENEMEKSALLWPKTHRIFTRNTLAPRARAFLWSGPPSPYFERFFNCGRVTLSFAQPPLVCLPLCRSWLHFFGYFVIVVEKWSESLRFPQFTRTVAEILPSYERVIKWLLKW